jgi:hypothetical protein
MMHDQFILILEHILHTIQEELHVQHVYNVIHDLKIFHVYDTHYLEGKKRLCTQAHIFSLKSLGHIRYIYIFLRESTIKRISHQIS